MLNMTFRIAASEWACAFFLAREDDGEYLTAYAIRGAAYGRRNVCAGLPW